MLRIMYHLSQIYLLDTNRPQILQLMMQKAVIAFMKNESLATRLIVIGTNVEERFFNKVEDYIIAIMVH